ncbi:MAG: glycine cleavage system aminomethyltransferase GcvT [Planctomycetes bacterium]|nr:glycine cleavage system aminomethyltransferase GcvT [Planctomycetota bacterium]
MTTATLLETPFHAMHLQHHAKMTDFAGWDMPLHFGSIIEEHRWTRSSAGFFDVSHMGRLKFTGRHARRFLDRVCTRGILGMTRGAVRYGLVLNEQGGCRDDILVYCLEEDEYLVVCNASNRAKLLQHFAQQKGDLAFKLEDQTVSTAMVAIQGPKVMELVGSMSREIPTLKRYRFVEKSLMVVKLLVSRTGYTGEDGVEIILGAGMAKLALGMLLKDMGGASSVVKPCGLGARDTLRMEAGMPLYGHEIDETVDPLTAGLGFAVKMDKGAGDEREVRFIGQDALEKLAKQGLKQKLVGVKLEGRRSARQGMPVLVGDKAVGRITSGCLSPTLDAPIAMAIVDRDAAEKKPAVMIDLGRERASAVLCELPFHNPTKPGASAV